MSDLTAISCKLIGLDEIELLRHCIQTVYGETYPLPQFYNADYIRKGIEERRLYSLIAQNADGDVIGNISTILDAPGDYTADGSAVMVSQAYRGKGVMGAMGQALSKLHEELGLVGLHLYALALHDVVQKQSLNGGAVITGILPGYFNKNAIISGFESTQFRIGGVCLYMPLNETPHRSIYLPSMYADTLASLYEQLSINRAVNRAPIDTSLPIRSVVTYEQAHENQDLRLIVSRAGKDIDSVIQRVVASKERDNIEVIYIDFALNDPGIEHAVQTAKKIGFFFGGLIVERSSTDKLRMQHYDPGIVSPNSMVIASSEGHALLAFILNDQASSQVVSSEHY